MQKLSGREGVRAFAIALALVCGVYPCAAAPEHRPGETTTNCDDACNLKYCTYTCCHITWGPLNIPTALKCSSTGCCAHPTHAVLDDGFPLPGNVVQGVSGPIKWELVRTKGLDASRIVIESEDKAKIITIRGAVKSAAERDRVNSTARRHAKGYKIVNQLEIKK